MYLTRCQCKENIQCSLLIAKTSQDSFLLQASEPKASRKKEISIHGSPLKPSNKYFTGNEDRRNGRSLVRNVDDGTSIGGSFSTRFVPTIFQTTPLVPAGSRWFPLVPVGSDRFPALTASDVEEVPAKRGKEEKGREEEKKRRREREKKRRWEREKETKGFHVKEKRKRGKEEEKKREKETKGFRVEEKRKRGGEEEKRRREEERETKGFRVEERRNHH
ncbi:uncharacterized protein LOC143174451 [Nomia melanderi]|uniref:uncharacterized protein LOC143174451 n=1 Tax=Nomia melanderi TaxID=2448451 RepID=UPI003FCCFAA7